MPTSCLLGCVDVVDVLPQEEYRDMYPDGESNSPYVFVCTNPQELLVKFPMQGQHKICKYTNFIRPPISIIKEKPLYFQIFSTASKIYLLFYFQTKWILTFTTRQENLRRKRDCSEVHIYCKMLVFSTNPHRK